MQWPPEIVAAFNRALEIEPAAGWSKDQVLQKLLDETARRAVWRAQGDPAQARAALRSPYTPLGSLVGECVEGLAKRLVLHGDKWGEAVQALHGYIEANAAAVFEVFQDEAEPYDDKV